MPKINYIEGDLFEAVRDRKYDGAVVIPHVCNSKGGFGAGFVVPLANAYPEVKSQYLRWFDQKKKSSVLETGEFSLGHVQFVRVGENVWVANMIAQTLGGHRPLSYKYLGRCMERVFSFVTATMRLKDPKFVCPMFGSGLAGGNWCFIEELIEDHWGSIPIDVHYLPQFLPTNWTLPENGIHEFKERP